MIKRQQRIERIAAVEKESLAATAAGDLLHEKLKEDPEYAFRLGFGGREADSFERNLASTYIIRIYSEFEAGLRDYWANHLKKTTHPRMAQLIQSISNERFSLDCIENADAVREYRNFLVHDESEVPPPNLRTFSVEQAKSHLCRYFGRLDPNW